MRPAPRAVALLVAFSLVGTACFPENARYRAYAKISEGVALAAGVVLLAVSTTQADCDSSMMISGLNQNADCKSHASTLSGLGLGLILLGLGGFVATVSTTPDDKTPTITIKAPPTVTTPPTTTPPPASLATPTTPATP